MCGICGCGPDGASHHHHHHHDEHEHEHVLPDGRVIRHSHHHDGDVIDFAAQPVLASDGRRVLAVQRDILEANADHADRNRAIFARRGVLALNLISSPGAGKTTLLVETLKALEGRRAAVIEGDQATDLDGARIRATGTPAIQINTGKACHLDARMIAEAAMRLELAPNSLLFIENVGNLVCPAGFDLGEGARVVLASVTEGEDKPLKYPEAFASADLMLVTKIDLVDALGFDVDALVANARRVNPGLRTLRVSARSGAGMADWLGWLAQRPVTARG